MPAVSKSKLPDSQPAQQLGTVHKEIVIPLTISINLGREFQSKIPFLIGVLLLFSFALIMFEKSNLKTTDISDLQRMQFNIPKLYSFSFILFAVLFAMALALAIYYAIGLGWVESLLVLPATLLPAIVLGMIAFPALFGTFVYMSLTVLFAAIVASFWTNFTVSRAWALLSVTIILFSLFAFLVVFGKVSANKDAHIDLFLDTLVSQAQTGGSIPITGSMVSSAVTKDDFSAYMTENDVRAALVSADPAFANLDEAQKTALVQSVRTKLVDLSYASFQKNSGAIAQSVSQNLAQLLSGGPQAVKAQIYALPQFKLIYDHFSFLAAAMAASVAATIGFFIQLLALAFLFILSKLVPMRR